MHDRNSPVAFSSLTVTFFSSTLAFKDLYLHVYFLHSPHLLPSSHRGHLLLLEYPLKCGSTATELFHCYSHCLDGFCPLAAYFLSFPSLHHDNHFHPSLTISSAPTPPKVPLFPPLCSMSLTDMQNDRIHQLTTAFFSYQGISSLRAALPCSLPYVQSLKQCLKCSRFSRNTLDKRFRLIK